MARLCNLTLTVPAEHIDELRNKLEHAVNTGRIYDLLEIDTGRAPVNETTQDEDPLHKDGFPDDDNPDTSGVDFPDED